MAVLSSQAPPRAPAETRDAKYVPICFARMPDEVLSGLPLFLRSLDAAGTESFRLYASAGLAFNADHRRRLLELGINFLHIPVEYQAKLRRDLEARIEMVADDSAIDLAVRCEIIYETGLELVEEMLTTRNIPEAVPRLRRVARSIVSLHQNNPLAFHHFFGAARHDAYPAPHAANVAAWLPRLAISLGHADNHTLTALCLGALLYDIGMVYMPPAIRYSEAKLNARERQQMQLHPEMGAQLLRQIPDLDPLVAIIALQHHERLDGSGYPRGLTFDRIHEAARMIAVIDAYDALTSFRPYRKEAQAPGAAIATMRSETPHRLDPRIVDAWTNLLQEVCPKGMEQKAEPTTDESRKLGGVGGGRRRFERYSVNCPATLRTLSLVGGIWMEKAALSAVAHNLSRGGLGILSRIPLQPGQYLRARLKGKDGADRTLAVMVVRSRDCGDGWFEAGTRFVDLAQEACPLPEGEFVAPAPMPVAGATA